MSAESNEIPAVRDLVAGFDAADVHGCVMTVDTMHTQTDPDRTSWQTQVSPVRSEAARLAGLGLQPRRVFAAHAPGACERAQ